MGERENGRARGRHARPFFPVPTTSKRLLRRLKWSVKVREASFNVRGSAPWGTPYNGLYGEAPPERGIFFRRQVYERVGILLLVKVYEMGRKICHLGLWKGPIPSRVNRSILWLYKVEKTFYFFDWFLFKRQCIYSSWKGYKVVNKVCERGTICK